MDAINGVALRVVKMEETSDDEDRSFPCQQSEQIVSEAENGDDDDDSFNIDEVENFPTDDIPTDDDVMEYDTSDDETVVDIEMKPDGYTPNLNLTGATLGEESKALLFWREDDKKSFSDWKIKVVTETEEGNENATIYSVHRVALAMGPIKSGYFEALFNESSESMNTVTLSAEVAAHFPYFLDYIYSQGAIPSVKFENWKSMKHLANLFVVPTLTEDVIRFIEKDMYNLEHMEDYLPEFNDIVDDLSKRIIPKAARACVEMIHSIKNGSSLLVSISPAMFLQIIWIFNSIESVSDDDRDHVHGLVMEYLNHIEDTEHIEEELYFNTLSDLMGPVFFDHDDVKMAGMRAVQWFDLMGRKGWESNWLTLVCTAFLRKYLLSQEPKFHLMDIIMKAVPNDVVASLFREALIGKSAQKIEDMRLRCDITLFYHGFQFDMGERKIPARSSETISLLKHRLARELGLDGKRGSGCQYMELTYGDVEMDDDNATIESYGLSSEDNEIKVEWHVHCHY